MKINFIQSSIVCLLFLLCISLSYSHDDFHLTQDDIDEEINNSVITYGSALRIENILTKYQLYSNKYTWGTGSQLQIITGIRSKDDINALWVIKSQHGSPTKNIGEPVMCNDVIRLEHSNTGKNLHSHSFKSWITDSQEACGFGEDGLGDVNDNFKIICYGNKEPKIYGHTQFFLQHVPTNYYLYINVKTSLFDERNCRNCPIMYQREVSLTGTKDKQSLWKVTGGLLFDESSEDLEYLDDEEY